MTPEPGRPELRASRPTLLVCMLVAIALVTTVAACASKTPAQIASDELAAGLAAAGAGDSEQAMTHYLACLKQEPSNQYCLYNMGVHMGKAGRLAEAENYYRLALAQDPQFPNAMFNLALILSGRDGSAQEAIGLFRSYVQLEPDDPDGHLRLGLLLAATGDEAGAKAELETALRLNPQLVIPSPVPTAEPTAEASPVEGTPTPTVTPTP